MSSSSLTLVFPFSLLLFFRGGPGEAMSAKQRCFDYQDAHSWNLPAAEVPKREAVRHSRVPMLSAPCSPTPVMHSDSLCFPYLFRAF